MPTTPSSPRRGSRVRTSVASSPSSRAARASASAWRRSSSSKAQLGVRAQLLRPRHDRPPARLAGSTSNASPGADRARFEHPRVQAAPTRMQVLVHPFEVTRRRTTPRSSRTVWRRTRSPPPPHRCARWCPGAAWPTRTPSTVMFSPAAPGYTGWPSATEGVDDIRAPQAQRLERSAVVTPIVLDVTHHARPRDLDLGDRILRYPPARPMQRDHATRSRGRIACPALARMRPMS